MESIKRGYISIGSEMPERVGGGWERYSSTFRHWGQTAYLKTQAPASLSPFFVYISLCTLNPQRLGFMHAFSWPCPESRRIQP